MTARRIPAVSAALLALLAGGALRAENVTEVAQTGADNLAVVEQIGGENVAGDEFLPMVQEGYFNALEILQDGEGNRIGVLGNGLRQVGQQGTVERFNEITIDQRSDNNLIGEIRQHALGAVPLGANTLEIRQSGAGGNRIWRVEQLQADGMPGQSAEIEQSGTGNRLALVRQISASDEGLARNVIKAVIRGDNNARSVLHGYALEARVRSGRLIQSTGSEDRQGNGNEMDLLVTGDHNDFGIRQHGRRNWAHPLTINGSYNSLGIDQDGTHNEISMSPVDGDFNEIGMIQLGTNTIEMMLQGDSSHNRLLVDQMGSNDAAVVVEGDRNDFQLRQGYLGGLEGDNRAQVRVYGSDNRGVLLQEGRNVFDLHIEGDRNNNVTAGFSTTHPLMTELAPGTMTQTGTGNTFVGKVGGDDNQFSFLQQGSGNMILLHVTGSDNEARFLQSGAGNTAELGQTGRGNQAIFIQH